MPAQGVLSNDSDPDGDLITAQEFSAPGHGTLTPNADGSFSYTPNAGYTGTDSFTYKAKDVSLLSNAGDSHDHRRCRAGGRHGHDCDGHVDEEDEDAVVEATSSARRTRR